jgi:hypothetical protein
MQKLQTQEVNAQNQQIKTQIGYPLQKDNLDFEKITHHMW